MNATFEATFWLILFPLLAQFVYLSFGPEPRWPMWAQGTLVPHYEYTPGCRGIGTGPCGTCAAAEKSAVEHDADTGV